jgi:hypothetical protein
MHYQKIVFGFDETLVPLIETGDKTFTYRLGDKYDFLVVGDSCWIENSTTHQPFVEIEILNKTKVSFRDLPIDRKGHEIYASKEEQRRILGGYYQKSLQDDDSFLVFEFKVLK